MQKATNAVKNHEYSPALLSSPGALAIAAVAKHAAAKDQPEGLRPTEPRERAT